MNYPRKKLGEVLDYEQPGKYIVASKNYSGDYKTPVLTAGKTFILGNTNEKENIFPANKLPVIIFDDFTTATQFVDFPFKVKSSAMKILHPKKDRADAKYLFYLMQTIKVNHATHKRFWISEYSKIEIPVPSVDEQKKIVARLEKISAKIKEAKQLRAEAQEATKNLLSAELHKIFEDGKSKDWKEKELEQVAQSVADGTHGTPKYHSEGFPLVTSKNLKPEGLSFDTAKLISSEDYQEINKRSSVSRGDILIGMIGTIGNVTKVNTDIKFSIKNVGLIRPSNKEVLADYIFYYLNNCHLFNLIKIGGSTQKFMSLGMLRKINVKYPSIEEQKKIVARLDALSEKIKKLLEYQNQTQADLIALEKSILHQAFAN